MSLTEGFRRSLRRVDVRLAANLVALFAPLIALLLLGLYIHTADELLEIADEQAQVYLDEVERALRAPPGAARDADLARIGSLLAKNGSAVRWRGARGKVLLRGGKVPGQGAIRRPGRFSLVAVLLSENDWLRYRRDLPGGQRLELITGVRRFVFERSEVRNGFLGTLAIGLTLVAGLSILATRRALSPLRRATLATEAVDLDRLEVRLPVRGTKDDVDRHARAVNKVLERLEEGFARIRAFSQDAAHELRTPINRILNGAEVALLNAREDDPSGQVLEMIRDSAEQMNRLIDALLLLASEADGRLRLQTSPLPLADLFTTLSEIYGPACEERGLRLQVRPASGTVYADRTLLMRAIANLLDIALVQTPAGGSICLEAFWEDGVATIRVSDTGKGIPEGERERIFERFVRLDHPRGDKGMGLGLPIARMLARAHGGDLAAGAGEAGGAVFSLRIPATGGRSAPVPPAES
jgi:signal transduction histidine kinase